VNGEMMAAEMAAQPEVLTRLVGRATADAAAVQAALPRPLDGVVFLARGSSDNAAVFGRYLAELAAGRPAGLAAPSLYTRYRATVDWHGYLVIALSQSGATPEIISTCRAMRESGAVVVGLTNEPNSALAATVDVLLPTDAGPERAVPATKTVTAQLALLATVAAALAAARAAMGGVAPARAAEGGGAPARAAEGGGAPAWAAGGGARAASRSAWGTGLGDLPGAVADVLADPGPLAHLARRWAGIDRLVVAGRGLAYAAALETALKVKETTGVLAEGISTADLLHGPIAAVYAGAPVLLIDAGGPAAADIDELRSLLTPRHADVVTMPLPPGPEAGRVITAVVRGQQLAYALARARGADPDAPANLSKVTATT
jgi:glutamine---fructose-6-phosphate transaminase (isomerizing)